MGERTKKSFGGAPSNPLGGDGGHAVFCCQAPLPAGISIPAGDCPNLCRGVPLNTIELFSGTKSFSKVMAAHGHRTFTVDLNPKLGPDLAANVRTLDVEDFPYCPDVLWASPPCQGFSVAALGKNWEHPSDGIYLPKTHSALDAIANVQATIHLIEKLNPKWFFIENPRAMLRKMPQVAGLIRHTVTYCQYGDTRQKPTDIWTNAAWWWPKPPCAPLAPCHERAPRGGKTGTQGLKNAELRGAIPPALFEEILEQLEKHNGALST